MLLLCIKPHSLPSSVVLVIGLSIKLVVNSCSALRALLCRYLYQAEAAPVMEAKLIPILGIIQYQFPAASIVHPGIVGSGKDQAGLVLKLLLDELVLYAKVVGGLQELHVPAHRQVPPLGHKLGLEEVPGRHVREDLLLNIARILWDERKHF